MSNESSASETTPLRRPESELSEDVVQATNNNNNNGVGSTATFATARNASNINYLSNPTIATTNTTAATDANIPSDNLIEQRLGQHFLGTNFTSNNNNNNNNIDRSRSNNNFNFSSNQNFSLNQQNHNIVGLDDNTTNPSEFNRRHLDKTKMDTNKRILCRVGLDLLILLCVGFPILCFFIWGDAYKRGFFCDDESLKHPFKESTVKSWMLYIILFIPVGVIIAVELLIFQRNAKLSNGNSTSRRYVFMNYEIPDWMVECYKKIGVFGFGAAVSQLTTDIAKYSIGRLRPHFFAVCQPILDDNTTCDDPRNIGRYIQNFTCRGEHSTARMLKEIRLSFPSGHSSITFYTMVYLALYLQSRMTWRGSKLARHFLQFFFIMIAWYTALTRISDYKHHWSDVLAGAALGSLVAVVVANYVSDLFQKKAEKSYFLPHTTQEVNNMTTINGNR